VGNVTATGLEVNVRPYRGILNGDESNGHVHVTSGGGPGNNVGPIDDNDPISQYGQWVTLPDLPPGQSISDAVVFGNQPGRLPNDNPKLEIIFKPAKAN
jgi:hypothetical protein